LVSAASKHTTSKQFTAAAMGAVESGGLGKRQRHPPAWYQDDCWQPGLQEEEGAGGESNASESADYKQDEEDSEVEISNSRTAHPAPPSCHPRKNPRLTCMPTQAALHCEPSLVPPPPASLWRDAGVQQQACAAQQAQQEEGCVEVAAVPSAACVVDEVLLMFTRGGSAGASMLTGRPGVVPGKGSGLRGCLTGRGVAAGAQHTPLGRAHPGVPSRECLALGAARQQPMSAVLCGWHVGLGFCAASTAATLLLQVFMALCRQAQSRAGLQATAWPWPLLRRRSSWQCRICSRAGPLHPPPHHQAVWAAQHFRPAQRGARAWPAAGGPGSSCQACKAAAVARFGA
jgi:hypothetical protein